MSEAMPTKQLAGEIISADRHYTKVLYLRHVT